ncbi:MAG: helix-turn-helix transcriptional regulator [Alphaproteobacteria bacterium]|nr:helix-turn-helix transcriptional regulator [Alphaproteobacteria bacterium]
MPATATKTADKQKLIEIALKMAAARGWDQLSLRDLAQEAQIDLAQLHDYFEDKSDILTALGRRIDRQVLENIGEPDFEMNARDRLFDVMMERFDILNEYREGLVAILGSFKLDPKQAVISMPHLCRSMTWMLEAAGVETTGLRGALKVTGLTGVYLNVLRTWQKDDTPDMGKTMAALDKDLSRAEQLVNMFGL